MRTLRIVAPLCFITAAACYNSPPHPVPSPAVEQPIATQAELRDDVRQLWSQRAFWSRLYIIDALAELPSQDATLQRLMRNQVELGEAMKPFYGDAAGDQLTALLQENITYAGLLIDATKDNDKQRILELQGQWQASTARIGDFLADANPYLPRAELQLQLQGYRDTTALQVTQRLAKNWQADIDAARASMKQAMLVADTIAVSLAAQFPHKLSTPAESSNEQSLHVALRELWEDHVDWLRNSFVSSVSQLPDLTATNDRLMENQVELGNALKPFYGNAAGTQFANLLTEHVIIAGEVLHAVGSDDALAAAKAKWQANADAIGAYLASANPYLDTATMQGLMRAHLDQLIVEMQARLSGDFTGEITAHDLVEHHILVLSDTIAHATSLQFTGNFKPGG